QLDTSLDPGRPHSCHYPDRADPPGWDYSEWCPVLAETLAYIDLRYRAVFGRAGWSAAGIEGRDGTPGIAANDDYRVYYTPALWGGVASAYWNHRPDVEVVFGEVVFVDMVTRDVLPGRSIWVFTAPYLFGDVIRHESGHGVHQVEVNYLLEADLASMYLMTLGEHVADFWALGFGRFDFAVETTEKIVRDHAGTGCEHSWWEGCPPEGCGCPVGCDEYSHLAYLDEQAPRRGDPCPGCPQGHWNGCVLTKVAYLMLREREGGPLDYHGVSVAPLRKALGEQIFYKVLNTWLEVETTPQEYGLRLRDQITITNVGCEGPDAPDACLGGGEDGRRAAAALGAVGFWSDAYDIGDRDTIRPESGLAAARGPDGTWIFFAQTFLLLDPTAETQHVLGVKLAEPFDATASLLDVANLTGDAREWGELVHPPVAATVGRDVWVAYVRGREGPVRFLHGVGGARPIPVSSPFPYAGDTNEPPALAAVGDELVMVYVDAAGGRFRPTLKWVSSRLFLYPRDVGRDGEDPAGLFKFGHDPLLVRTGPGADQLIVLYRTGWRPSPLDAGVLAVRRFEPGRLGWSDEMLIRRLDYDTRPWQFDAYKNLELSPVGAPAAAFHDGRIQVFYPRGNVGRAPFRGSLLHMSFVPAPASHPAPVFDSSGTRVVPLLAYSQDRPAVVQMRDSVGRDMLVVFWRLAGPGARLRASWKLSD
ncbi:MAG: hypothetical protein QME96_14310, partial [Myxococcota bacterium]|nr:hypothetical protein [Myxococcota bacterium]